MRIQRLLTLAAATIALGASTAATVRAQGLTTGAISGTVTSQAGRPIESAQIEIVNVATGFRAGVLTRSNGQFYVQGLEVGTYRVTARLIGYRPQTKSDIRVQLNLTSRVDFVLEEAAAQLAAVEVTAEASLFADFSPARQGVATIVTDTLLRRVPTLQRDFTEMVKLTPQVTREGAGPSAGGAYNRLNNFTVDGANQNDRFNLGSTGGLPGGSTSGRIMSVDAVKEFQVLMSPTDVRYGNFGGMLVNAVTRNGTNTWTGGATYTYRNPQMAANVDQIRASDFKYGNYGFTLGGPIIKDKLHFFIAPEFQDRTDPTAGPIPNEVTGRIGPVSLDSIAEIRRIMAARGVDVGSEGVFRRGNPLTNLFGRVDWQISGSNRAVFRILDNTAEQDELSRNTAVLNANGANVQTAGIRLTSNSFTRQNTNRSLVGQLFSSFGNGIGNEFLVGYNTIRDQRIVPVNTPEISVGVQGTAVTFGTERFSPGNDLKQRILEISDNVTVPLGAHNLTFGGRFEQTYIYNYFLSGAGNGAYQFPTIAALEAGTPSSYAYSFANGGTIAAEFNARQLSGYAQDLWNVSRNFSVTAGIRFDRPDFLDTPRRNDAIVAALPTTAPAEVRAAFNTAVRPKASFLWSPRLGFNWDVNGDQTTQLRGNIGVFTSQTPFILIGNAYSNTGLSFSTINCAGTGPTNQPPTFTTDVSQLPTSCAGQPAPAPLSAGTAGINTIDPDFQYPQNFTTSLGFDKKLPGGVVGTFEALYRRDINGLYVRDVNLRGPRLVGGVPYTDRNGRVLFADTISATNTVTNNGQRWVTNYRGNSFNEGNIQLTNSQGGYNYSLSGQLRKRFSRAFEGTAAYTYMQSRDVMSMTSDRAISIWRNSRQYAGVENNPTDVTISNFQRPHRFIAFGSYTAPWKKNQTDITFFFEGISGNPITYVANTDLNGDGFAGNDPIYVPKNAADPTEIRIGTGTNVGNFALSATEAQLLEQFIQSQPCLDKQRGKIMARNSCSSPFQRRMDVSVRQTLPDVSGHALTLQLDIFNFANLLNRNWGRIEFPVQSVFSNQFLFNQAGRTAGPLNQSMPNFVLNPVVRTAIQNTGSAFAANPNSAANNYQMQLTLRYSF
jgi:outer membrane receptor for ferrienterochelin and colicin